MKNTLEKFTELIIKLRTDNKANPKNMSAHIMRINKDLDDQIWKRLEEGNLSTKTVYGTFLNKRFFNNLIISDDDRKEIIRCAEILLEETNMKNSVFSNRNILADTLMEIFDLKDIIQKENIKGINVSIMHMDENEKDKIRSFNYSVKAKEELHSVWPYVLHLEGLHELTDTEILSKLSSLGVDIKHRQTGDTIIVIKKNNKITE